MNTLTEATPPPFDITALNQALHIDGKPLLALRHALRAADKALQQQFAAGVAVDALVHERALIVDVLIKCACKLHLDERNMALVAVGGYGRGELHPYSDIDLLILVRTGYREQFRHAIEEFIAFIWDIGLHASHSVRTLEECVHQARMDVTVATNLMEARQLTGDQVLFASLRQEMASTSLWPTKDFFNAKCREQRERHAKYHDAAYRLEPNIKDGPGGLRDIQMIAWLAKRHFNTDSLSSLVKHGFLTESEYQSLCRGQIFLWRIRFALHLLHSRCEDRLLFDSQVKLADQLGYRDTLQTLAVENFMQDYYKTIKELGLLNEMFLQLLEEAILNPNLPIATPLNDGFQEHAGFLNLRDPELFVKRPSAMLEIFLMLEQHPRFKGVSAGTLRSLRANLHRMGTAFRSDPANRMLFMQILREPHGVTHELRRMNRYGILGQYIPAFARIVGRMQYDLFHAYTVDEHILFVIGNLRRFALTRFDHEFPLCSQIMQGLPKPELAYLGALFHDIAKGRGGDHSLLGADEAQEFCLAHGLSRYDARLVAWLVQHHLLLSLTAQKKDINDPQVVHAFAQQVGDQMHLDYLYVLTVADIRGTNPELWNSWKASLCIELYHNASRALLHGLENPIDKEELIRETMGNALARLCEQGVERSAVHKLWDSFSEEYFLHHSWEEIAWHTACLAGRSDYSMPVIFLRQQGARGGTAVCIHSTHDAFIFGRVTAALAELGLTVLDARLTPMTGGSRLDTYAVLEDNGEPISDMDRLAEIERLLRCEISRRNALPFAITRRAPRQVRMFTTPTRVEFADDPINQRTVLEISTGDQPGLLSLIGKVFGQCHIRLQNAKITTVGERAEDVFFITDAHDQPINDSMAREVLRRALLENLDEAA